MTLTSNPKGSSQRRHRQRGIGRLDPTWDARPINWRGTGVEPGSAQNIEPEIKGPPGHPELGQQVAQNGQGTGAERPDAPGRDQQADAQADPETDAPLAQRPAALPIAAPQANRPADRIADNTRDGRHDLAHWGLGGHQTMGDNRANGDGAGTTWPPFNQTSNRAAPRANHIERRSTVAQEGMLAQSRLKLIDDLRVMKRTRFNAQARFEAKHTASVSAFTLAAIVEIGLSLLGSNFGDGLSADVVNFIDYASQVTAVFILGFGLVVALAGHQTKALYLQRCAKDWGNLSREMQIAGAINRAELQDFRRRYHEIEGRCPPNHSDVDLEKARLDNSDRKAVRDNKLDYLIDVYLSYAFSALALTAFWIALWRFMVSA